MLFSESHAFSHSAQEGTQPLEHVESTATPQSASSEELSFAHLVQEAEHVTPLEQSRDQVVNELILFGNRRVARALQVASHAATLRRAFAYSPEEIAQHIGDISLYSPQDIEKLLTELDPLSMTKSEFLDAQRNPRKSFDEVRALLTGESDTPEAAATKQAQYDTAYLQLADMIYGR